MTPEEQNEQLSIRKVGGVMNASCPICSTKMVITVRVDFCPNPECDYAQFYERY